MSRYRDYHRDICPKSHENWLRKDCLELACKRDRHALRKPEELIEEAKIFERYVLDEPECQVVYLKE